MLHLLSFFLQRPDEHLALRRLSGSIETFKHYELAATHDLYVECWGGLELELRVGMSTCEARNPR